MDNQESVNELLVSAWIRLTSTISNDRIVEDMPYNEAIICNLLYRNAKETPEHRMTATELCKGTGMLKSLMNRTLNSMEAKGMITRERSNIDKRQVYITMNQEEMNVYLSQHTKILDIVNSLVEKFGKEKVMEVYNMFEEISNIAQEVLK